MRPLTFGVDIIALRDPGVHGTSRKHKRHTTGKRQVQRDVAVIPLPGNTSHHGLYEDSGSSFARLSRLRLTIFFSKVNI